MPATGSHAADIPGNPYIKVAARTSVIRMDYSMRTWLLSFDGRISMHYPGSQCEWRH